MGTRSSHMALLAAIRPGSSSALVVLSVTPSSVTPVTVEGRSRSPPPEESYSACRDHGARNPASAGALHRPRKPHERPGTEPLHRRMAGSGRRSPPAPSRPVHLGPLVRAGHAGHAHGHPPD